MSELCGKGDGHAEGENVNRVRDSPSFCPTLQVLCMSFLLCLSSLLRSRFRKFRGGLWITLCMLRRFNTVSELLAPYDKIQGDPERYLWLAVSRKIPPKRMVNTATQTLCWFWCVKNWRERRKWRGRNNPCTLYTGWSKGLCIRTLFNR
jgi:hypothetical protein